MLSITSFTVDSGDFGLPCYLFDFLLKLYFSFFLRKHLVVTVLTDTLSLDLICWETRNYRVPVKNILQLFYCVFSCFSCNFFCGCLVLEFGTVVFLKFCEIALEAGSSVFVAWSWFLHGFDFSDQNASWVLYSALQ